MNVSEIVEAAGLKLGAGKRSFLVVICYDTLDSLHAYSSIDAIAHVEDFAFATAKRFGVRCKVNDTRSSKHPYCRISFVGKSERDVFAAAARILSFIRVMSLKVRPIKLLVTNEYHEHQS
jgi:hypothetical protein